MINIENDTYDYHLGSKPWNRGNINMPCLADTLDESVEPLDGDLLLEIRLLRISSL